MMIATEALKATQALIAAVPLLGDSPSEKDYNNALELVEELLIENPSSPLLDIVCARITEYERQQPDIQALRDEMAAIPAGLAVLRTLMDQYNLTISDFADEIGSKSMVSRVLKGERQLNVNHIKKLSDRFNISPAAFI
ncbi:TPA: helix-turn-helix domain-containing protein [Salmonella enterica subsp. enterica serovar Ball]|uniref:Helix-turn-helix domain-containing protein n=1 Tax=Salmonella enterica subsp. salamae TaxID=59202 RepID=A0A6D2G8H0_SALER|nr:transcriptional regulator [Salmonella enterica subsp. enterica]EAB9748843.1 helix-turn-helix domain-containing protein [Salmonella enterica subsp. salamae]EAO6409513.1 helix-turn-helix domain-containing protein [Salmonella enterica]EBV5086372.1 transcriptional regulator [Salmonella enterica subsp. enterica serovar Minnesota]EBW4675687.1 transcriptional regulator [Salmonella enterica subsp. salamae serovar Sofia]EDV5024095.1 helix-turn-helix domain-containing protein [Salmonella enterica sub